MLLLIHLLPSACPSVFSRGSSILVVQLRTPVTPSLKSLWCLRPAGTTQSSSHVELNICYHFTCIGLASLPRCKHLPLLFLSPISGRVVWTCAGTHWHRLDCLEPGQHADIGCARTLFTLERGGNWLFGRCGLCGILD